jgi:hypothetical protein
MKIWQRLTQTIGAVSILLALWGFHWLVDGVRREQVHPVAISEAPFFRQAFFIMTAIDATFLSLMILTAVGLLRLKRPAMRVYTRLFVTLAGYIFAVGALWTSGPLGRSIAAASGVGDIGLGPLVFYPAPFVYPVLSAVLINIASRKLATPADTSDRCRNHSGTILRQSCSPRSSPRSMSVTRPILLLTLIAVVRLREASGGFTHGAQSQFLQSMRPQN